MTLQDKADPAIYQKLRTLALAGDSPGIASASLILMDWNLPNGTASVLAGSEGTASLYLSSGGGFIGGSQRHAQLRDAALHAVSLAARVLPSQFLAVEPPPDGLFNMPRPDQVGFWWRGPTGIYRATALEANLRSGHSALAPLGAAMQQIVTLYRTLPMGQP